MSTRRTERLILARHGESECSASTVVNGDPRVECPLTAPGREEARRLGEQLRGEPIDLCVTSEFGRTIETAAIALASRDVPREVIALLNDPMVGDFESKPLAEYMQWHEASEWDLAPPGGGESQLVSVERYLRAYEQLLARSERVVLVVAHAFPISVALSILDTQQPALRRRYDIDVAYAVPHEVRARDLREALERLRRELEPCADAVSRAHRSR